MARSGSSARQRRNRTIAFESEGEGADVRLVNKVGDESITLVGLAAVAMLGFSIMALAIRTISHDSINARRGGLPSLASPAPHNYGFGTLSRIGASADLEAAAPITVTAAVSRLERSARTSTNAQSASAKRSINGTEQNDGDNEEQGRNPTSPTTQPAHCTKVAGLRVKLSLSKPSTTVAVACHDVVTLSVAAL